MNVLVKQKILTSTGNGFKDKYGNTVNYMKTKHKQYIIDEYADMAQDIMRGLRNGKEKA